jgi:hypothetical protein
MQSPLPGCGPASNGQPPAYYEQRDGDAGQAQYGQYGAADGGVAAGAAQQSLAGRFEAAQVDQAVGGAWAEEPPFHQEQSWEGEGWEAGSGAPPGEATTGPAAAHAERPPSQALSEEPPVHQPDSWAGEGDGWAGGEVPGAAEGWGGADALPTGDAAAPAEGWAGVGDGADGWAAAEVEPAGDAPAYTLGEQAAAAAAAEEEPAAAEGWGGMEDACEPATGEAAAAGNGGAAELEAANGHAHAAGGGEAEAATEGWDDGLAGLLPTRDHQGQASEAEQLLPEERLGSGTEKPPSAGSQWGAGATAAAASTRDGVVAAEGDAAAEPQLLQRELDQLYQLCQQQAAQLEAAAAAAAAREEQLAALQAQLDAQAAAGAGAAADSRQLLGAAAEQEGLKQVRGQVVVSLLRGCRAPCRLHRGSSMAAACRLKHNSQQHTFFCPLLCRRWPPATPPWSARSPWRRHCRCSWGSCRGGWASGRRSWQRRRRLRRRCMSRHVGRYG